MDELRRALAPVSDAAWAEIEDQARQTLKLNLAARKLVDFDGPHGWERSAVSLGRVERLDASPVEGIETSKRLVLPLIELRSVFSLERRELEAITRGARDADLEPVTEAAQRIARAEDALVFYGYGPGCMRGMVEASPHEPIILSNDYLAYAHSVVQAIERLRRSGVGGPYALALGPRCYAGLSETLGPGGYPLAKHVKQIIEGPMVWAPAVDGAVVLSMRGGDFELTVGRDLSIGYLDHDATSVRLYIEESAAFRVIAPEAAVSLRYPESKRHAPGFQGAGGG